MKILKNKVGRPSNEFKLLKKVLYISIISIVISFMAIIFSSVAIINNAGNKIKGATSSPIIITSTSASGIKSGDADWENLWTYSFKNAYALEYDVQNHSNKQLYYRYFAMDEDDNDRIFYNGKTDDKFDNGICYTKIPIQNYNTTKIKQPINLMMYDNLKLYLRLYDDPMACMDDDAALSKDFVAHALTYHRYDAADIPGSDSNLSSNPNYKNASWIKKFFWSIFRYVLLFFFAPSAIPMFEKMFFSSSTGEPESPSRPSSTTRNVLRGTFMAPIQDTSVKMKGKNAANEYTNHDISVLCGTPIYAPANGKAVFKTAHSNGRIASYGNIIEIETSTGYKIILAHLDSFVGYELAYGNASTYPSSCSQVNCSEPHIYGEKNVTEGEIIGYVGTSGNSSGCHLHLELRKGTERLEPSTYFGYDTE